MYVVQRITGKFRTFCVFEPPFGGLGTTYDVHLELFSLGVTSESLRAKIDRKSAILLQLRHFDPKFQVEGVAPTNHFCTVS